jgi:hypothetical protein
LALEAVHDIGLLILWDHGKEDCLEGFCEFFCFIIKAFSTVRLLIE